MKGSDSNSSGSNPQELSSSTTVGSRLEGSTTNLIWIIKDFRSWAAVKEAAIKTPQIKSNKLIGNMCQITLSASDSKEIQLYLNWCKPLGDALIARIQFSILDADFSEVNQRYAYQRLTSSFCTRNFDSFIKRDALLKDAEKLLVDGDLTLLCQITIYDVHHYKDECRYNSPEKWNLAESLGVLFTNKYFSDLSILAKEKEFICHKAVLAYRSQVFSNLLKSIEEEKTENTPIHTDVEPDAIEKLLCYVYTGEVDVTVSEALQLWVAADKYGLDRLKVLCEEKLSSCLSLENVAEIFSFASINNLQQLKNKAFLMINFTKQRAGLVSSSFQPCPAEKVSESSKAINTVLCSTESAISGDIQTEIWSGKEGVSGAPLHQITKKKRSPPHADICCITESHTLVNTMWPVKIFSENKFCGYRTNNIISSHIIASENSEDIWQIDIHIEEDSEDTDLSTDEYANTYEYLSLHLMLVSSKQENIFTEFKFSILNVDQKETKVLRGVCCCAPNESFTLYNSYVKLDDIRSTAGLVDDSNNITMCCSLKARQSSLYDCAPPTIPKSDLVDNISVLITDMCFTDVVIKVEEKQFPCHKALLACQSPYFLSLFRRNPRMKVVEIKDLDAHTFSELRLAIYTGKCELLPMELLVLATTYDLHGLRTVSEDKLIEALTVDNSVKTLLFADSQKAEKLKKYTTSFIAQHLREVMQSSDWADVAKHGNLLRECLSIYLAP